MATSEPDLFQRDCDALGKWHEEHQTQPSQHAENEEEVRMYTV